MGNERGKFSEVNIVEDETLQLRSEKTSNDKMHALDSSGKLTPTIVIGNVTTDDGGEIENNSTALFIIVKLYRSSAKNNSFPRTNRYPRKTSGCSLATQGLESKVICTASEDSHWQVEAISA